MGWGREKGLGFGLSKGKMNQQLPEMQRTAKGRDTDKTDPALIARQIKSGRPIRTSMGIRNLQLAQEAHVQVDVLARDKVRKACS